MVHHGLVQRLVEEMGQMEIVDAHEHLPPESERLKLKLDVCFLFSHYTRNDLISAGMSPSEYERMLNPEIPLDERFSTLGRFLPFIRFGSYARPAFIALRDIYGYNDITRQNYREISEKMAAMNKPGIYRKVLVEKCKAKFALTQAGRTDYTEPFLIPILPLDYVASVRSREEVEKRSVSLNMTVRTLDDYIAWMKRKLETWKQNEQVIGLKTSPLPRKEPPPSRQRAEEAFKAIMNGNASETDREDLQLFLTEETFRLCAEWDLVVAVHSGVWGDFRRLDPSENIAYALAQLIDEGRLDLDEAVWLARLWFYENPTRLYGLDKKLTS